MKRCGHRGSSRTGNHQAPSFPKVDVEQLHTECCEEMKREPVSAWTTALNVLVPWANEREGYRIFLSAGALARGAGSSQDDWRWLRSPAGCGECAEAGEKERQSVFKCTEA